jgi:hypothetical protein
LAAALPFFSIFDSLVTLCLPVSPKPGSLVGPRKLGRTPDGPAESRSVRIACSVWRRV